VKLKSLQLKFLFGRGEQLMGPGIRAFFASLSVLLFACAAPIEAQVTTHVPEPVRGARRVAIQRIKVHAPAIAGNLEGESPDRSALVVLPPSYAAQPYRRYPVVYALHGYSIGPEQWIKEIHVPQTIEGAFAKGAREMIVVLPDAKTVHNGSMYSSSVTTGDFETFITRDLVSYIDAHYRTIADRRSRGLVGHSMGGYGATRLGMKHPDVFGALYMMSPCCLSPRDPKQFDPALLLFCHRTMPPAALQEQSEAVMASMQGGHRKIQMPQLVENGRWRPLTARLQEQLAEASIPEQKRQQDVGNEIDHCVANNQDQQVALPEINRGGDGPDREGDEDPGNALAEVTAGKDQQRNRGGNCATSGKCLDPFNRIAAVENFLGDSRTSIEQQADAHRQRRPGRRPVAEPDKPKEKKAGGNSDPKHQYYRDAPEERADDRLAAEADRRERQFFLRADDPEQDHHKREDNQLANDSRSEVGAAETRELEQHDRRRRSEQGDDESDISPGAIGRRQFVHLGFPTEADAAIGPHTKQIGRPLLGCQQRAMLCLLWVERCHGASGRNGWKADIRTGRVRQPMRIRYPRPSTGLQVPRRSVQRQRSGRIAKPV
jgi:enterochelin esterase-like enzyme